MIVNVLLSIYFGAAMLRSNLEVNGNDYSGLALILPAFFVSIAWVFYDNYIVRKLGMKFKPVLPGQNS